MASANNGRGSLLPIRLIAVAAVTLPAAAIIVAWQLVMLLPGPSPDTIGGAEAISTESPQQQVLGRQRTEAATPAPEPASPSPTGVSVDMTFDELPTASAITGWTIDGDATLTVAGEPTAVQRSARLETSDNASACPAWGGDVLLVDHLSVVLMVDQLPTERMTIATLKGSPAEPLVVELDPAMGLTITPLDGVVAFQPGEWYEWQLSRTSHSEARVSLQTTSGEDAMSGMIPLGSDQPIHLCFSTVAPVRVYVDSIQAE